MKTFNTIYNTVLLSGVVLIIFLIATKKQTLNTDLEIYTNKNIYYISGLTVTNEVSDEVITFKDRESLKVFISDVTSGVLEYHY